METDSFTVSQNAREFVGEQIVCAIDCKCAALESTVIVFLFVDSSIEEWITIYMVVLLEVVERSVSGVHTHTKSIIAIGIVMCKVVGAILLSDITADVEARNAVQYLNTLTVKVSTTAVLYRVAAVEMQGMTVDNGHIGSGFGRGVVVFVFIIIFFL